MNGIKQSVRTNIDQVQIWLQQVGVSTKQIARQNLPILGIFLLVGAIALWHTLPQFRSALIGQESSATLWNFGWLGQALRLNFDIMMTNHTVFPFQQNLLLTLSPLFSLLFNGLTGLAIAPQVAFNLLYFISFMFTGWAMWVYLTHQRLPSPIVLLVAVLFTFSPLVMASLRQGRPDFMALGWLPLGCWVLDQIQSHLDRKRGIGLFAVWWGALLTSFTVGTLAFTVWLPYFGYKIWQTKGSDRRLLIDQVLFQALLYLAACMTYPLPGLLKTLGKIAPETMALPFTAEILSNTTSLILLYITWFLLIVIAVINQEGGRERWFWTGLTAVLASVALISQFSDLWPRSLYAPADWLIPATFTGSVLIATSLTPFWESRAATNVAPLIVVGLLVAVIAGQATPPTVPWQSAAAYPAIGREGGDYTILDVPFGVRSRITERSFGTGASFEQYAAVHQKRTLVGTLTRPGDDVFETYQRSPLFQYLAGETSTVAPEFTATLQDTVQKQRIGYVIAHPIQLKEKGQIDRIDWLNSQPSLCKVFESPAAIAYRTTWHPFDCKKSLQ